jgi:hypothetical protein
MAPFVAFKIIPVLAALWIAGGGLVLTIEVITAAWAFILGKAVRTEFNAPLAALGLVFVAMGLVFRALSGEQERGPQLVLLLFGGVSLLGALVTLVVLWPDLRRRT